MYGAVVSPATLVIAKPDGGELSKVSSLALAAKSELPDTPAPPPSVTVHSRS